ncbi:transposase [Sorangium sp. So ce1128]
MPGREPPAGPQWLRGLSPLSPSALAYDKPLCASPDGFTLHAATRAGAHHAAAREALLRYVLRPPIAQERVELQQDGLVRLSRRRAFADGTVAASMDPLSLLCRLATSVPPPRFHTVKYAGVLASASRPRWRASASDRALRSRNSPRRRTTSPLPNASGAAIGLGPSFCAARLRSMSSSARSARAG